ncbi:MAG: ABC transporter ATP-binding protein [Chloroflexi bacterium]|nr:ABC transporter ATP-binding protein [Chloroflexota bacterium]
MATPTDTRAPTDTFAAPHPQPTSRPTIGRQLQVEFRAVGRAFVRADRRPHQVIRDVSLTIAPGEVVAILGPSGCGKSTLLRLTAGLDRPTSGAVCIEGSPVRGIDDRSAVAFQEPRLLPWRSLAGNVALGLPAGTPRDRGAERVAQLLALVGLDAFAEHRPREVSGGMAQRAALARALARDPGVLLLDEPFASLDALTRMRMQDLVLDIHAAAPTTVLLVTHDVDEALQLADRVILLGSEPDREGATIREILSVPGDRPRDRGSAVIAELRAQLLEGLGVSRHAQPAPPPIPTAAIGLAH